MLKDDKKEFSLYILELMYKEYEQVITRKENFELKTEIFLVFLAALSAGIVTVYVTDQLNYYLIVLLLLLIAGGFALFAIRPREYLLLDPYAQFNHLHKNKLDDFNYCTNKLFMGTVKNIIVHNNKIIEKNFLVFKIAYIILFFALLIWVLIIFNEIIFT